LSLTKIAPTVEGFLLMNPWNSGKLCLHPIIFWKGPRASQQSTAYEILYITPKLLGKIFTCAPLRFRKNMFAAHDFLEKVLELRNNPPLNPTANKILHVNP
jgi:hypothetical protein